MHVSYPVIVVFSVEEEAYAKVEAQEEEDEGEVCFPLALLAEFIIWLGVVLSGFV